MDFFNSRWLLKALLATIDRERNIDPTPLLASEVMITGPDQSRHHMIVFRYVSTFILSHRRPSESHSLPTFPLTIYLMMCAGHGDQQLWTSNLPDSTAYERSEDNGLKPPESEE